MTKYFLILIIFCTIQVYSQTEKLFVFPSPKIGWDSLKNTFVYPELARRAGVRGYYEIRMTIDSAGNIIKLTTYNDILEYPPKSDTTMMSIMLEGKLRAVKWNPATLNGKPVTKTFIIPLLFLIKYDTSVDLIIKETSAPYFIKDL